MKLGRIEKRLDCIETDFEGNKKTMEIQFTLFGEFSELEQNIIKHKLLNKYYGFRFFDTIVYAKKDFINVSIILPYRLGEMQGEETLIENIFKDNKKELEKCIDIYTYNDLPFKKLTFKNSKVDIIDITKPYELTLEEQEQREQLEKDRVKQLLKSIYQQEEKKKKEQIKKDRLIEKKANEFVKKYDKYNQQQHDNFMKLNKRQALKEYNKYFKMYNNLKREIIANNLLSELNNTLNIEFGKKFYIENIEGYNMDTIYNIIRVIKSDVKMMLIVLR